MEIVSAIGVLERVSHNMIGRYTYSGNSEIRNWARNGLGVTDNESKTINWGVYTKKQEHAKMLAVAFKNTDPPEVHGSGKYAHYHEKPNDNKKEHNIHFWFGNPVIYY